MSDAKVERRHRGAALSGALAEPIIGDYRVRMWVMTGGRSEELVNIMNALDDRARLAADAEPRGYAAGRAAERADVVAWLRKRAIDMRCAMTAGVALVSAAHHIECGEHVSPRPSTTNGGPDENR
jgi:hypothetical protein